MWGKEKEEKGKKEQPGEKCISKLEAAQSYSSLDMLMSGPSFFNVSVTLTIPAAQQIRSATLPHQRTIRKLFWDAPSHFMASTAALPWE